MSAKTNRVTFSGLRNYNFLIFIGVGPSFSSAYNIQRLVSNFHSIEIYKRVVYYIYSIGMLASMEESSWECFIHDTSSYFSKYSRISKLIAKVQ